MLHISYWKSYCYLKLNMSKFKFGAFPLNLFPNLFIANKLSFYYCPKLQLFLFFLFYKLSKVTMDQASVISVQVLPIFSFLIQPLIFQWHNPYLGACNLFSLPLNLYPASVLPKYSLPVTTNVVRLLPSNIFPSTLLLPTAEHKSVVSLQLHSLCHLWFSTQFHLIVLSAHPS